MSLITFTTTPLTIVCHIMNIQTAHDTIQKSSGVLKIIECKLRGNVSVHTVPEMITLSTVYGFQKIACQLETPSKSFVGSIDGCMSLSINYSHDLDNPKNDADGKKRKRTRDSSQEDAEFAVSRVERSGSDASNVSSATFSAAKKVIASVLRLKGANGENVVESWAVSLRKPGDYGNISVQNNQPAIVIGFRLSAGVAIPLSCFCAALSVCRDGIITTSISKIDKAFHLPLTTQGSAAEENGQKSLLCLATVPALADTVK